MGFVSELKTFDVIGSLRAWPGARAAYLSRGFALGKMDPDPDLTQLGRCRFRAKQATEEARSAIEDGDDELGISLLNEALKPCEGGTMHSALADVAARRIALRGLEQVLVDLADNAERLHMYRNWVDSIPPIDLAQVLRVEAAGMTTRPKRSRGFKMFQSRIMQAWTRLFDETDGFQAPPEKISDRFLTISDEPGTCWTMVQTLFPVFAQTMSAFGGMKDRHSAMRDLLDLMIVHAESGQWPENIAVPVRVVRGKESAVLATDRQEGTAQWQGSPNR